MKHLFLSIWFYINFRIVIQFPLSILSKKSYWYINQYILDFFNGNLVNLEPTDLIILHYYIYFRPILNVFLIFLNLIINNFTLIIIHLLNFMHRVKSRSGEIWYYDSYWKLYGFSTPSFFLVFRLWPLQKYREIT